MSKSKYRYDFQIEVGELGYADSDENGWRNPEFIEAWGNNLDELFDNAVVHFNDQDGGEKGFQAADEDWMQNLIAEQYYKELKQMLVRKVGV